jgi:hypothetical protein
LISKEHCSVLLLLVFDEPQVVTKTDGLGLHAKDEDAAAAAGGGMVFFGSDRFEQMVRGGAYC